MVKRANKKPRYVVTREKVKLIYVGLEGNNKTESKYIKHISNRSNKYKVCVAGGNSTHPVGVVQDLINTLDDSDFDYSSGDRAYCLIDTDFGKEKEAEIEKAIRLAKKHSISVILSNPTFEIWFLLHFRYSTKPYTTNEEVLIELRKYIPDYQKNLDVFPMIASRIQEAIGNAEKLERFHDDNQEYAHMKRCPSTKVFEFVRELYEDIV